MMNLKHLKKKLILRKEKLTLKILRKENLKIMKIFTMMKMIMMVITSGWIIHDFS